MELIPAGCQEVVNKEHLTDPDSAHRSMWVYSAAEPTDITKAPREKSSDGNCSGVISEAERITTLDGLTSPACVTILETCLHRLCGQCLKWPRLRQRRSPSMRKRIASLSPAFERPALPVLPRRSRCLVRPNC